MTNKNAFSFIEIIIATGIITISIFGVYKMIGENNKVINYSNNKVSSASLIPIIKNCIINKNINSDKFLSLGNDLNECGFSDDEKSFKLNNINYTVKINYNINSYNIQLSSEETGTQNFKIKK